MSYLIEAPASICFSGGRTSGKMLHDILQAHNGKLPADMFVCFENTGKEVEPTLIFVEECSQRWSVPIYWLEYDDIFRIENYTTKSGKLIERRKSWGDGDWGFRIVDFQSASRKGEPYAAMLDYYAEFRRVVKKEPPILPTVVDRMCTSHLKIKVNSRFMRSRGHKEFNAIMGIRYDEPKRWAKMLAMNDKSSEPYTNVMPLYDERVTKQHVNAFWEMQSFNLGIDANSYEGNCDNCFLKGLDKQVNIMRRQIERNNGLVPPNLQWWADREAKAGMRFRRDRPSYAELIQIAQAGEVIEAKDEPIIDCFCGEA